MNGASTFDKYIKMSWQMIQTDIMLACMCVIMMAVMSGAMGYVALFLLAGAYMLLINAARKLFYTSIYGKNAVIYQSLPVGTEEAVLAKVVVMSAGGVLLTAVIVLVGLWTAMFAGNDTFTEYMSQITGQEYLNEFHIPYILIAGIAGIISTELRFWLVCFFAIAWYNSLLQPKRNFWTKAAAAAIFIIIQAGVGFINNQLPDIAGILLDVIIAAVLYKITVRLVGTRYNLSQEV